MKKIFHIVSNREWGGGEQYVYDLCRRQMEDGYEVCIFCKPIESIIQKYQEVGIRVIRLNLNGILDVRSAWNMAKVIKDAGACTIHAHNFKDAFTACYARKFSSMQQVRVVMCRHLTRKGKTSLPYRWLYRQLDCLCFDSELSKSQFLSTHPVIDESRLCVVHTSIVMPADIQPAPLHSEIEMPSNAVVAMYHGRLDPEKGLDILIEAVGLIKDRNFRMVLIGRGSDEYTAHLRKMITDRCLDNIVHLLGFRHPIYPYVAASDFGILASIVPEGCPLSPQEYMSQGKPVVASDNGGQSEYIRNRQNGLLVSPGNSEALAVAMRRLIDDSEFRQSLGVQARKDYENYLSYEHFYKQISRIYQ